MMHVLIEAVGWVGAVLILGSYGLLSMGRLEAKSTAYQLMNVIGAVGFVINSGSNGAYPSAVLNTIWIAVGLTALVRNRKTA